MIHRHPENTVNTDKNKYFRMIGFWTSSRRQVHFRIFGVLIHPTCKSSSPGVILSRGFCSKQVPDSIYLHSIRTSLNPSDFDRILLHIHSSLNLLELNTKTPKCKIPGFRLDFGDYKYNQHQKAPKPKQQKETIFLGTMMDAEQVFSVFLRKSWFFLRKLTVS